ncbi:MAG: recombinase family protein [Proteobacteria bacterium]|nr:recombinase family protein [Pseudomonadota bacterium]MBU4385344.1 recombinase family protein [Pseudomonadota bacterium]
MLPTIQEIKKAGIVSLAGIAGALNARGVPTPRGRKWYATSVRNVLSRA